MHKGGSGANSPEETIDRDMIEVGIRVEGALKAEVLEAERVDWRDAARCRRDQPVSKDG